MASECPCNRGNLPSLKSSFLIVKEMVTAVLAHGDVSEDEMNPCICLMRGHFTANNK